MASHNALFDQADINHDGSLSEAEFRNMLARNSVSSTGASNFSVNNGFGNYGSSSYEMSNSGNVNTDLVYGGAGYGSSVSHISGDTAGGSVAYGAGGTVGDAASFSSSANVQQYETDAQGYFKDNNPQIVRRPAPDGPVTYTQNIRVRFLQPPAAPAPGALIIKEMRPPQPPPPPPLVIHQRAPPIAQPPPLILRERPPPIPAAIASQTILRNLAAVPVPPRSVVIERLPAAPPRPRDIIIERWIPYGVSAKRKTIVQRAEAVREYPKPRNIIIQYDAPQIRVVRQFQRLSVTPENPEAYLQRYGAALFDTQTLVQQARAAGVVEDISPPMAGSSGPGSVSDGSTSSSPAAFGFESYNASGIDAGAVTGDSSHARASFYGSPAYSTVSDLARSSYGSSSYRSSTGGTMNSAFAAADVNNDGVLSLGEFRRAGF